MVFKMQFFSSLVNLKKQMHYLEKEKLIILSTWKFAIAIFSKNLKETTSATS